MMILGSLLTANWAAEPFAAVSLSGDQLVFESKRLPQKIVVALFYQNIMYASQTVTVAAPGEVLKVPLAADLRQCAAGRQVRLECYPAAGLAGTAVSLDVSLAGKAAALPKPVNFGRFADGAGVLHFWYMSHAYEYIFDGEKYFPFGGMWCPVTLEDGTADEAKIAANMAYDLKVLDGIAAYGINDVYFNRSINAPDFVKQRFIDEMERRNIRYGYQLTIGENEIIPGFFITRQMTGLPNWQQPMLGRVQNKVLTVEMPLEYKINSLLLSAVRNGGLSDAILVKVDDVDGKDSRHGIIDLDKTKDHSKTRTVTVPCPEWQDNQAQVLVIPLLDAKMSHPDLLDPDYFKAACQKTAWLKNIRWGKNFRFIVDPLYNETHLVNGTENLRQYTPHINRAFAAYLKQKYAALPSLQREWDLAAADFDTAARLIPQSFNGKLYWLDPESGKVLVSDPEKSAAWLDYNDFIRVSYAAKADEFAQYIKSLVDVPVIYKSVEGQGSKTYQSTLYRGFDGIGFEVYLNQGLPQEGGGSASRAEAEFAGHTVWKVATEAGYCAALGNGGAKFFPDQKTIDFLADELSKMGVSGFYFFGFALGEVWSNHNYHDCPAGLDWVKALKERYQTGNQPKAVASSFIYPAGSTWWWWTTRNLAVYGYEASDIAQATELPDHSWAYSTNVVPEERKYVLINCPRPPFSHYYRAEIARMLASGKPVIYLGTREDLGAIPELDRYFTGRKISFADGTQAQVLKAAGGKILAGSAKEPWAVKFDNLIIISRTPIRNGVNNTNAKFQFLDPAWLTQ